MAHDIYSPSARPRWANCPGSTRLIEALGVVSESSEYAEEGTRAHALAEEALRDGRGDCGDPAVQVYVDYVRGLMAGVHDVWLEGRMDHPSIADIGGTVDFAMSDWPRGLHIVDYKHGSGVFVSPVDNLQLQQYAVLAAAQFGDDGTEWDEVHLTIVQPRWLHDEPVRTAVYPGKAVHEWRDQLFRELDAAQDPAAPLVPGEHCMWCPAKPHCAALYSQALVARDVSILPIEHLTDAQIDKLLTYKAQIEKYLSAVYATALARALEGSPPTGWKAVEKVGYRKWVSEDEAIKTLRRLKVHADQYAPRKLVSPAQAEKLVAKDVVAQLTERPVTGYSLVRDEDPRLPASPVDAFD